HAGYIQYWFVGHFQNESWVKDNPWLRRLPSEAKDVHLSIGRAEELSRDISSAALTACLDNLPGERFETIIIEPHAEKGRVVRAYQKAGFRPIPELEGKTPGVLLMKHVPRFAETRP